MKILLTGIWLRTNLHDTTRDITVPWSSCTEEVVSGIGSQCLATNRSRVKRFVANYPLRPFFQYNAVASYGSGYSRVYICTVQRQLRCTKRTGRKYKIGFCIRKWFRREIAVGPIVSGRVSGQISFHPNVWYALRQHMRGVVIPNSRCFSRLEICGVHLWTRRYRVGCARILIFGQNRMFMSIIRS